MPEPISIGEASEDECAVCRSWPSALRQPMRSAIYVIPLKEPVCEGCVVAFWINNIAKAQHERPG